MRIVTGQEMQAIDARAIHEVGIPSQALMENAGAKVAAAAGDMLAGAAGRRIIVVAGRGNNGADGCVAARHLANQGARVKIYCAGNPDTAAGDARLQFDVVRRMGIEMVALTEERLSRFRLHLGMADMVVDALLGTGFKGSPRSLATGVIHGINQADRLVLGVDVPSGVDADTGAVEAAVYCRRTVTFGLPKLGLLLFPGASYAGDVRVVDIGFPKALLDEDATLQWATADRVGRWLPKRPADSHKGTYGHVLVVGGSTGMTGAAMLAARGAQRVGAGLVTLALPAGLNPVAEAALPEVMTHPLPETALHTIAHRAASVVTELAGRRDVLVLGPGMSQHEESVACVRELVAGAPIPLVVDADGLNALAVTGGILESRADGRRSHPLVVTPHPGEMARLVDTSVEDIRTHPVEWARSAAQRWQAVVVLKGARTVVADATGHAYLNTSGGPALATGGTGDVLAGAIGGLLAQGVAPLAAAAAGVYLHGVAGDLVAQDRGGVGVLAGEVADRLPQALSRLKGESS